MQAVKLEPGPASRPAPAGVVLGRSPLAYEQWVGKLELTNGRETVSAQLLLDPERLERLAGVLDSELLAAVARASKAKS
jgi:hypothetical protein